MPPSCLNGDASWFEASLLAVGDFHIRLIRAGVYWWDGGAVFGVVPKTLWSKNLPGDEFNRVPLAFNCYLIETPDSALLIETGGGTEFDARARERMRLPERLEPLRDAIARNGFDPDKIDTVINSHLHWDHCSGNMQGGEPSFPNATYYTQRAEWEYAHTRHPRDSVSYRDENYDPLVSSGQMRLLDGDFELAPGIQLKVAPGHNRDMMIVKAASGGETFCFFSDLILTAQHVQPTWVAGFDLFPVTAIDTKLTLLDEAYREGWWCGFGHDTRTAFARIDVERGRYYAHAEIS